VKWLFNILGIKSELEKKKSRLADLQRKAFEAQRNGDLRTAGKYLSEAEQLETEIVDETRGDNESR
tara:strand:- start:749 stop:946 length:198 start_codon:yes stop_codon:yes gene_type:complete